MMTGKLSLDLLFFYVIQLDKEFGKSHHTAYSKQSAKKRIGENKIKKANRGATKGGIFESR